MKHSKTLSFVFYICSFASLLATENITTESWLLLDTSYLEEDCSMEDRVNSYIYNTKEVCVLEGKTGIKLEIMIDQTALPITICYDTEHKTPLYTEHSYKYKASSKKIIADGTGLANEDFENAYHNYPKIFSASFPGLGMTLHKGHMVPSGDVYNNDMKYYANMVPMWSDINIGVWKRIENVIRRLAKTCVSQTVNITTMATGVLNINELNTTNTTELYLRFNEKQIPVPQILQKEALCTDMDEKAASLYFIVYNNPRIYRKFNNIPPNVPMIKPNCHTDNICEETLGKDIFNYNNIHPGTIFCCKG